MLKRFSLVVSLSALALLWVAANVNAKVSYPQTGTNNPPAQTTGPNLLTNPGLEGHYNQQCSLLGQAPWIAVPCNPKDYDPSQVSLWATAQVPSGWSAWWRPPSNDTSDPNYFNNYPSACNFGQGKTPDSCVPWHNPEFRDTAGGPQETGPERRIEGDNSQKYFTFYSVHEAGLYQVVGGVKPGQKLRFSVYMEAWSSAANNSFKSEGQTTMGLKVGIDPYGGNNPWSGSIIWSPVQESFDHFSLFTVEAVARNSVVSVWTRSLPLIPQQHNDVYVDAASLNVVGATPITSSFSTRVVTTTKVILLRNGVKWTFVTTATLRLPRSAATPSVLTTTRIITATNGLTRTLVTTATITAPRRVTTATFTTPRVSRTATGLTPVEYVVLKGDSLRAIAKARGLHWADIVALNPVIQPPDYKIYPGQVIRLQ